MISQDAFNYANRLGSSTFAKIIEQDHWNKLRSEIDGGKTLLIVNENADVVRLVSLTVLELRRADGCQLVQIAKFRGTKIECQFGLPGVTSTIHDRGDTVADDFLEKCVAPLHGYVTNITLSSKQINMEDSTRLGIRTMYMRTVVTATLDGDYEDELESVRATDRNAGHVVYLLGRSGYKSFCTWTQTSGPEILTHQSKEMLLKTIIPRSSQHRISVSRISGVFYDRERRSAPDIEDADPLMDIDGYTVSI